MKTVDEFYKEVVNSKDLQKEFLEACKSKTVEKFLQSHDCNISENDLKEFLAKKYSKEGKVEASELNEIAGACGVTEIFTSILTAGYFCVSEEVVSEVADHFITTVSQQNTICDNFTVS